MKYYRKLNVEEGAKCTERDLCCRVLLEELVVAQSVKKLHTFIKAEGSLSC
jgi:hypothetical protein